MYILAQKVETLPSSMKADSEEVCAPQAISISCFIWCLICLLAFKRIPNTRRCLIALLIISKPLYRNYLVDV